MSVPKKKRTSSSVGRRRSHHSLDTVKLNTCPQCKKAVQPHSACAFCGFYKQKEVVKPKTNSTKKK